MAKIVKSEADALRERYQSRLMAGERIAQFAREAGVSESTMRYRLAKLGVDTRVLKASDGRYGGGEQYGKVLVSPFYGRSEVDEKVAKLAVDYNVDLNGVKGSRERLKKVLQALVRRHSNLQISRIFEVDEKSFCPSGRLPVSYPAYTANWPGRWRRRSWR